MTAGCLLSAAGCGVEEDAVAAQSVASASELDAPAPQLVKFLEQFHPGEQADLVTLPASIDQAIEWSTVVLTASIEGVVDRGRFVPEPGSRDDFRYAGIVLRPQEILRGRLQPGLDTVTIGMLMNGPRDAPGVLEALVRSAPPDGVAVFFLRWGAARPDPHGVVAEPTQLERVVYNWVARGAVFAQGPDGVLAPMSRQTDRDTNWGATVASDGLRFADLSDLAAAVSHSKAQPQRAS